MRRFAWIVIVCWASAVDISMSVFLEDYHLMSDLSKYEAIRGDVRHANPNSIKGCTAVRLWILHRHGTRYPSSDEIASMETLLTLRDEVISNHKKGRGTLTRFQLERLRKWTFDSSMAATPMYLTKEGHNETFRTASRFKERFPNLLGKPYSPRDYYFQHSETERTLETSLAFVDGLFGQRAEHYVRNLVLPSDKDYLLYPFGGACEKLANLTADSNTYAPLQAFLNTDEYMQALKSISKTLGFKNILSKTNLTTMFDACGYDSAWKQESEWIGPWCAALGSKGCNIGEYLMDLEFQAMSGYGTEVTERAGCGAPRDLWQRFATATGWLKRSDQNQTVTVLFTHDNVIMLVHTALNLLKDNPPLTPNNFKIQGFRKWRTSKTVPFAGNIAAVLYECNTVYGSVEYKVQLLRNEHPFDGIPNCPGGVCSWSNFKNFVKPVADSCTFDDFC